ncbi:MAG: urate hydroxylase PuuD [Pseudomonadales bacterium]
MEVYIVDWFSLIVRWLHLITGIAWIGASLHFIWLDNSLQEPPQWKKDKGIKGDLWAIHGGGIYEFNKYHLAPPSWPTTLHWSKWEAYTTWITGTFLIVAVYYLQAQSFLVGPDNWISDPQLAVAASVGFLTLGIGFYELAVRSPLKHKAMAFAILIVFYLTFLSWLSVQLFSDRAAYLHIGALMGTIMAGNVFLGIIPAQKAFVKAIEAGNEPNADLAAFAKLRSTHNNYFTLPVLFCMISNHYPFLYGHEYNWVILIYVMGVMAYARHFFNLRHRGIVSPWIIVRAVIAFLVLAVVLGYERVADTGAQTVNFDDNEMMTVVQKNCTVCHSQSPTFPGFLAPPGGVIMDSKDDVMGSAARMTTAVRSNYMPLGNVTNMSKEERADLLAWLASGASQ